MQELPGLLCAGVVRGLIPPPSFAPALQGPQGVAPSQAAPGEALRSSWNAAFPGRAGPQVRQGPSADGARLAQQPGLGQ